MKTIHKIIVASAVAFAGAALSLAAWEPNGVMLADFTRAGHGWVAQNHVKDAVQTPEGYKFTSTDEDPWCVSQDINFPALPADAKFVRFELEVDPCKAKAGDFQIFWARGRQWYGEGRSTDLKATEVRPGCMRFVGDAPATEFVQGPTRFRIDPPCGKDTWVFKSLKVSFVIPMWTYTPATAKPYVAPARTVELSGRAWRLLHDAARMGSFTFEASGRRTEHNAEEPVVWLDGKGAVQSIVPATLPVKIERDASGRQMDVSVTWTDSDGCTWCLSRRFSAKSDDALSVRTSVDVSKKVRLLHMPWLTLFVDRASAGHKAQALLPGLEYLEDEPSSNKKDIRTHESNRLIPAPHRLCYPLMLLTQKDGWTSLGWKLPQRGPAEFSPVFDTPDRQFKSGGHLFALWSPAVGNGRRESGLSIFSVQEFSGGVCEAELRTGSGVTVSDALVTLLPQSSLPEPPAVSPSDYFTTLARGWLKSEIRVGDFFRHATMAPSFKPHPAADAPALIQWLAAVTPDAAVKANLKKAAQTAWAALPAKGERRGWGFTISHICRPVAPLLYGDALGYAREMDRTVATVAKRIEPGYCSFVRNPDKPDFASTLGSRECNGYTAMSSCEMLRAALWTGDEAKIANALSVLDKVTARYSGTVPRGAQPWEMPLHTPDICASARLVYSYVYAYLLRPDPAYLLEARAWARTGLTMVYLDPARGIGPVGRYATIGVMGATHWVAPNWMGRPVQWCGLDYGASLFELAKIDPDPVQAAYWRKVATGIAASGQQQCHPVEDGLQQGLLPDSFNLVEQTRFAVPINPGTLQENAAEAMGRPYYTVAHPVAGRPELIHVPGAVTAGVPQDGESLRCKIKPWPEAPFRVVISRVARPKSVTWNGKEVPFTWEGNVLVVELSPCGIGELALCVYP